MQPEDSTRGFRYQLSTPDGEFLDEAEYAVTRSPGDVIYASRARRVRVLAVVPAERIEELVDRPM